MENPPAKFASMNTGKIVRHYPPDLLKQRFSLVQLVILRESRLFFLTMLQVVVAEARELVLPYFPL